MIPPLPLCASLSLKVLLLIKKFDAFVKMTPPPAPVKCAILSLKVLLLTSIKDPNMIMTPPESFATLLVKKLLLIVNDDPDMQAMTPPE